MTIYVDDIFDYPPKGKWCHLWSDDTEDVEALHQFAQSIGLKRSWFQISSGASGPFPHYDLRPSKRLLALKKGAKYISLKEWIKTRHDFKPLEARLRDSVAMNQAARLISQLDQIIQESQIPHPDEKALHCYHDYVEARGSEVLCMMCGTIIQKVPG